MARLFKRWSILERGLLAVGVILCAVYGAGMAYRSVASRAALAEFDGRTAAVDPVQFGLPAVADETVDFSLWSEKRVREYRASVNSLKRPALGVLSLPRLGIRVPVFEGTDEVVLNRGAGWILGTSRPGADGNTGIAAHRDGFFRGVKDIAVGDDAEFATPGLLSYYKVDQIEIVLPDNVGVLQPRGAPSLTLVTCYPFYFVGDAPQRFIVHAKLEKRIVVGK